MKPTSSKHKIGIENTRRTKFTKRNLKTLAVILLALVVTIFSLVGLMKSSLSEVPDKPSQTTSISSSLDEKEENTSVTSSSIEFEIPEYNGTPYVKLNNNMPQFEDFDTTTVFETYSELDFLGRCGVAFANICKELMPTEERESISDVKPSGWTYNGKSNNNRYEMVDGGYIYNRCHLIGFQLAIENSNSKNLITGTRSLNVDGMLQFENMVADHIKEDGGHVLYRVTPRFVGNELVCRGVQIEAYSVEDNGEDICFNVFCFNVQPGIEINYMTGENRISETISTTGTNSGTLQYVINENSKKFHYPNCDAVKKINAENKLVLVGSKEQLLSQGYSPCKICEP